jgi:hypothetical protein
MKIIRLTTTDETCQFSSTFDSDIIVSPDSKVALSNLGMERVINDLIIDGSNDKIKYTVRGTANEKEVLMSHASYTRNDIDLFEADMADALNGGLVLAGKEIGHQFKVDKNTSGKFHIQCLQADAVMHQTDWVANAKKNAGVESIKYTATSNGKLFKESIGVAGNNNDYMSTLHDPLCKGAGVFRARVYRQVDVVTANGGDGFIVGLSSTDLSAKYDAGTAITYADMDYAVYYPSNLQGGAGATEFFYTIEGANPVATATNVEYIGNNSNNNNIIDMSISAGRLKATVYSNSGGTVGVDLIAVAYEGSKYYPFIIIRGNGGATGTTLNYVRATLDPYLKPPTDYGVEDEGLGVPAPPRPNKSPSTGYIEFESADFADALGFNVARQPNKISRHYDWLGQYTFELHNLSDAFLVQMKSMELESYDDYDKDGFGGGRKNLLAIVPYSASDAVIYEPNNLLWIDLNNMSPMNLRNIYARVVKSDYSTLNVRGLTSMTILVKGKDE